MVRQYDRIYRVELFYSSFHLVLISIAGQVYFYQSELPYDADGSFADDKFVGYKVGSNVTNHSASGLGIYSNFRDHDVEVWTGVIHPRIDSIHMKNIFTVKLDNMGKISSVVNGFGPGPVTDAERGVPHRCSEVTCPSGELGKLDRHKYP